jgi:hypothetical protein
MRSIGSPLTSPVAAATAGGGPLAAERVAEGASLKPSISNWQRLAQRMGLAPSTIRSSADGPPPAASRGR